MTAISAPPRPSISLSALEIAQRVNGSILGDSSRTIGAVAALEARSPHSLSFIRTTSKEVIARELVDRRDQVLLVPATLVGPDLAVGDCTVIAVGDPYVAFLDLLPIFHPEPPHAREIHPTAVIHPSATIGKNVAVGAHCSVGEGCVIGDNCILHAGVRLYRYVTLKESVILHSGVSVRDECVIGCHVTVHNNSVIGADGFGYIPDPKLGLRKVPQVGNVVIEDHVEIGANTCIDRGAFGSTRIGFGSKIDNQVQIGHNVTMGKHCIICGQTGIAGSVTLGDRVLMAGGSGAVDHVTICSDVRLGGRSGAGGDITEPGDYQGFPAIKASTWKRIQAATRRLAAGKKRSAP